MSLTVVARDTALRALARIRAEDKEAFASIRRALAALAEQPHPDEAVAWGGTGIYRLRLADIRILYEVDEDAATVYVINVAVTVLQATRRPRGMWHPDPGEGTMPTPEPLTLAVC